MNSLSVKMNQKGVSLLELLISIVVGSMVISMLMSILVMSMNAKVGFDADNKMQDESFYITEFIQFNVFQLGPQELELKIDDGTQTVIHIKHMYDITTDGDNVIIRDYSAPNPIIDILIYDKVAEQITFNGGVIHSSNVFVTTGSSIELVAIDDSVCDVSALLTPCDQGIIKLTLNLTVLLSGGGYLTPQ